MPISIRPLAETDLETAEIILNLAFQSSSSRLLDLRLCHQMQPDGWFLAVEQDQPLGMVGATNYGAFAYVGFMAVHPAAQRRGLGLALMQFLLARLDEQQLPLVLLDASAAGQPLYEKLGFVAHEETLLFQHPGTFIQPTQPPRVQPISMRELAELVQWDTLAFGANRQKVLQTLISAFPERAFMLRDTTGEITGYLLAQKTRIGPWVMRQPQEAEALLQAALTLTYDEKVSVVVPAENQAAIALLRRYGFEQVRANRHMGRGQAELPGQRHRIYAQTSFAVG